MNNCNNDIIINKLLPNYLYRIRWKYSNVLFNYIICKEDIFNNPKNKSSFEDIIEYLEGINDILKLLINIIVE